MAGLPPCVAAPAKPESKSSPAMSRYQISILDDLRRVAFKVCTALDEVGIRAVLTGGSAATIYAPEAYQSRDADFIASWNTKSAEFEETLRLLGFFRDGRVFSHPQSAVTLDFPDHEVRIGDDFITRFSTLTEGDLTLRLLTPTDSVCDRLAHFYWYADRSALAAALAVARNHPFDEDHVRDWSRRHGEITKCDEFFARLAL